MQKLPFSRFTLIIFSMTTLVLIVLAIVVPKGNDVLFINGRNTIELDQFFKWATEMGNGWIFLPVVLALLFVRYSYFFISISAWALHGILVWMCKDWLFDGTKRPTAILDNSLLHFVDGVNIHKVDSFPSGHTATAFCFAALLSLLIPNRLFACAMLCLALIVGYSRIYLLQHFLIDVAGGATIGTISALLAWCGFGKIKSANWMDGNLTKSWFR